jgi:hypothetical protein
MQAAAQGQNPESRQANNSTESRKSGCGGDAA